MCLGLKVPTASGATSYLLVRASLVIEVLIVFGHVTICSSATSVSSPGKCPNQVNAALKEIDHDMYYVMSYDINNFRLWKWNQKCLNVRTQNGAEHLELGFRSLRSLPSPAHVRLPA